MSTNIAERLQHLMFVEKIRITELARRANLPQPTVHRIVNGIVRSPHKASLLALADYFNISLAQLTGEEPLDKRFKIEIDKEEEPPQVITTTSSHYVKKQWVEIPLFNTTQLQSWPAVDCSNPTDVLLLAESDSINENAIATLVTDASMEPLCNIGDTIIINPSLAARDRALILIWRQASNTFVVRQMLLDGDTRYIKALANDFRDFAPQRLSTDDMIIGPVVQIQHSF